MKLASAMLACISIVNAQEMGIFRTLSENKFETLQDLPKCITVSVQSGDPAKGASIVLFKATPGCTIPWHWHTATENVMMVTGRAKVEMRTDFEQKEVVKNIEIGSGGFVRLPGKHRHQFTCTTACIAFVSSDAAFDIHYVDISGAPIPTSVAVKTAQ